MGRKKSFVLSTLLYFSVLIGVSVFLTGCGASENESSQPKTSSSQSGLDSIIGDKSELEVKEVMDADEIKEVKWDYDTREEVEKFLTNQPEYEEEYQAMCELMESTLAEDTDCELYGEKEVYIFKKPVYYWSVKENRADGSYAMIFVFSTDFSKSGIFKLYFENGKKISSGFSDGNGEETIAILKEKPDCQYLFVSNGYLTYTLNDENVISGSIGHADIIVQGDYYHATNYEEIGMSYEELTNPDNLIKITFP